MNRNRLVELYNLTSKHSHYQILPRPLREFISVNMLNTHSRYEEERLDYILQHVPYKGASLVDIGGNTGYFSLELVDRGAQSALFIEGNRNHCAFMSEVVNLLGWQDRVKVHPHYMRFEDDLSIVDADVCLLLNVLHHVGDDYGDPDQSIAAAKKNMLNSLSRIAQHTKYLILQIGFNWKGNTGLPLFRNGTKRELIDFVESGTCDSWVISDVGIAEDSSAGTFYQSVSPHNIARRDSLGEFLNRPLFIMQSKLVC